MRRWALMSELAMNVYVSSRRTVIPDPDKEYYSEFVFVLLI